VDSISDGKRPPPYPVFRRASYRHYTRLFEKIGALARGPARGPGQTKLGGGGTRELHTIQTGPQVGGTLGPGHSEKQIRGVRGHPKKKRRRRAPGGRPLWARGNGSSFPNHSKRGEMGNVKNSRRQLGTSFNIVFWQRIRWPKSGEESPTRKNSGLGLSMGIFIVFFPLAGDGHKRYLGEPFYPTAVPGRALPFAP